MYSSFQCVTYAGQSGQKDEAERLFQIGLEAGRTFIEALRNHEISEKAVSQEAPIGVTMYLSGPSVDFMIGRIFEGATTEAFKKIKQEHGPSSKHAAMESELMKLSAENLFESANCSLIR